MLVGRLTRDPELRALPSGTNVCSLRVACNSTRKNAEGDYAEKPNFFDVSVLVLAGETVHRYMSRGRRVADRRALGVARVGDRRGQPNARPSRSSPRASSSWTVAAITPAPRRRWRGRLSRGFHAEERELVGVGPAVEEDLVF